MPAFLLEIGLEEIPASMIAAAQVELAQRIQKLLTREHLATENLRVTSYSTLRRLAIHADGLLPKQGDLEEEVVGPSTKVAYKEGAPTPAVIAFAKKSGVEVAALRTIQNAKGEYVVATVHRAGHSAAEVLTSLIPSEIGGIYWPKNMYWRAGKPERFVRPVRWLLALLDEEILPIEFAGVTAGGVSYGHRILHGDKPVVVGRPQQYVEKLASAFVQVDPEARRHRIRKALDAATRQVPGARWREDEELVDIVTNLTEWPSVILGSFDASYLDLPEEILVTVMRDHQKYFALEDAEGKLLPHFLAVLNIEVDEAGAAIIRHGNERVLRARFNDARFFWDVDQKISLMNRVEMLKNVTFHKDLGSYWDKTQANLKVSQALADIAFQNQASINQDALLTAALLAKTDLTTELVKEFTELQGQVGSLYAKAQGFDEAVAQTIYSQYVPAAISGSIPSTFEGIIFGLADRMHTIASMFNIGLEPTGSKDPFALRRAGNAVVKMMATSIVSGFISISDLTTQAVAALKLSTFGLSLKIDVFLKERARFYLEVEENISPDCIEAAIAVRSDNLRDAMERALAVQQAKQSPDFLAISLSFKRIKNILRQAAEEGDVVQPQPNHLSFVHTAEQNLWTTAFTWNGMTIPPPFYENTLLQAAKIRPVLDDFFDHVMVMDPDANLRANRLALLKFVFNEFSRIADFSCVAADRNHVL